MRVVDLSFLIRPHFRWQAVPERVATHAAGDPMQSTVMTISCHAYTHVDAPIHDLPDGGDIASMPVDQWIGDAAVVDLTHLRANAEISAAELEYLTDLDGIGAARCRFIALPLRIETADGSPVRAVAIVEP